MCSPSPHLRCQVTALELHPGVGAHCEPDSTLPMLLHCTGGGAEYLFGRLRFGTPTSIGRKSQRHRLQHTSSEACAIQARLFSFFVFQAKV